MAKLFRFLGGVLMVALGAGSVLIADRALPLPGLERSAAGSAAPCPHTLTAESCPFCEARLIEEQGECPEHGVPEALCHRCRPALVAAFKANNDWCGGHSVPESQCYDCNPGLLPARPVAAAPPGELELVARALRAPSVGCRSHALTVKLKTTKIAEQIGLELAPVIRRAVTEALSCNAELSYDERRYARLSSRAPAVVRAIKKDLGARVKAGELIAVLGSAELAAARAKLLELKENLETARLKEAQARETYQRSNRMQVRLAAVEYLKATELSAVASRDLEREEGLLPSKATSEREVLAARAAALRAEAAARAAGKTLALFGLSAAQLRALSWESIEALEGRGTASAQPHLDAEIATRKAEADYRAAGSSLRWLGLTDKDIAAVEAGSDASDALPLYAPFDGELVERRAVVGEAVRAGDPLFVLADTSTMWAMIDIEEEQLGKAREGQKVIVQVQGLRGSSFEGQVTWLSSQIDAESRVLKARAELANADGRLRARMFARARLLVRDQEEALLVPRSAVQWEGCCNIVFVKRSETLFEPRKVQLAFETGEHAVISEGLAGDELVVTTGSFLLKTEILKGNIGAGCCGD